MKGIMYWHLYSLILGVLFVFSLQTKQFPLIEEITVLKNKITVVPHISMAPKKLHRAFFVEYDSSIDLSNEDFSIVTVPFVMTVAPMIWLSGNIYTIESMDEDLYYSLEKVKKVFSIFYPKVSWLGELIPNQLVKNSIQAKSDDNEIGLLFSGGVDSTFTSLANSDKKQLLITIWGQDVPIEQKETWRNVVSQCKQFACQYKQTSSFIKSNFFKFFNWNYLRLLSPYDITFQALDHTGLTFPLLYKKGINKLYIAASSTIDSPEPLGSHPLVDNNIACMGIQLIHHGAEYVRSEKVSGIFNICKKNNYKIPSLRVCFNHRKMGRNCCVCEPKCILTMCNILSEGIVDLSAFGFHLSLEKAIESIKNPFNQNKKFMCCGKIWDWKSIQNRMKRVLSGQDADVTYNDEVKAFASWFIQLDIENYCYGDIQGYENERPFWECLWNLGLKSPIEKDTLWAVDRSLFAKNGSMM